MPPGKKSKRGARAGGGGSSSDSNPYLSDFDTMMISLLRASMSGSADEDEPEHGTIRVTPNGRQKYCTNCKTYHDIASDDDENDEDDDYDDDDSGSHRHRKSSKSTSAAAQAPSSAEIAKDFLDSTMEKVLTSACPYERAKKDIAAMTTDDSTRFIANIVKTMSSTAVTCDRILNQKFSHLYSGRKPAPELYEALTLKKARSTLDNLLDYSDDYVNEVPSVVTNQPKLAGESAKERRTAYQKDEIDEEPGVFEEDAGKLKTPSEAELSRKVYEMLDLLMQFSHNLALLQKIPAVRAQFDKNSVEMQKFPLQLVVNIALALLRLCWYDQVSPFLQGTGTLENPDWTQLLMAGYGALGENQIILAVEIYKNARRIEPRMEKKRLSELYYFANAIQKKIDLIGAPSFGSNNNNNNNNQRHLQVFPPAYLTRYLKLQSAKVVTLRSPLPPKIKIGVIHCNATTAPEDLDDTNFVWEEEVTVDELRRLTQEGRFVTMLNAIGLPVTYCAKPLSGAAKKKESSFYYSSLKGNNNNNNKNARTHHHHHLLAARSLLTDPTEDKIHNSDRNMIKGNKILLMRKDLMDVTVNDVRHFIRFAEFVRREMRSELERGISGPPDEFCSFSGGAAATATTTSSSASTSSSLPILHHRHRSPLPGEILFMKTSTPEQVALIRFAPYLTKEAFDMVKEKLPSTPSPNDGSYASVFFDKSRSVTFYDSLLSKSNINNNNSDSGDNKNGNNNNNDNGGVVPSSSSTSTVSASTDEQDEKRIIEVAQKLMLITNSTTPTTFPTLCETFLAGESSNLLVSIRESQKSLIELQSQPSQQQQQQLAAAASKTTDKAQQQKQELQTALEQHTALCSSCIHVCDKELAEVTEVEKNLLNLKKQVAERLEEAKKRRSETLVQVKEDLLVAKRKFANDAPPHAIAQQRGMEEFNGAWISLLWKL